MDSDKLPYLKIGQVWKIPLIRGFRGDGKLDKDEIGPFGLYELKLKNSSQMWFCYKIFQHPKDHQINDQFHNRFVPRSSIVKYGTLLGEDVNINTIKILYGAND